MFYRLYSYFDKVGGNFCDIKIFANEQLAIRQFKYDCEKSPFGKDLSLYYMGEYNIESGKIKPSCKFVMNCQMVGDTNE